MSAAIVCLATQAMGAKPSKAEMVTSAEWVKTNLTAKTSRLPISFVYGGKPSSELLTTWKSSKSSTKIDGQRQRETITYTDPKTGLEVRCVAIVYKDFPTVEWTVYFKNTSSADTPIIESVRALDTTFSRAKGGEFILRRQRGDNASPTSYEPVEVKLDADSTFKFAPGGGRPTCNEAPYYNLDLGGRGVIIAAGWPGQWASEFARSSKDSVHVTFGQELTHFKLLPGEQVRGPMIVLQFWQGGDWIRSQNVWRRWMMAHCMPKPGGKLPAPMLLASSARAYMEMVHADEASQIMFINRYLEEGIKIDCWWMDAGWYANERPNRGEWPIGSYYEPDPDHFPRGIAPISDYAHSKGIKTLLWFEPENIWPDTRIMNEHPEYVLRSDSPIFLLNLGMPEARKWRTDIVNKVLTDAKVNIYRQDFNMEPISYWRLNDAEDRQGINEIKHIEGYIQFWDAIQKKHPDILIDSCASGGRRNELEAMRRAVPLWRSDYAYEPIGHQCMTYGLSLWLPYNGTGTVATVNASYYGGGVSPVEPYAFWSNAAVSIVLGIDAREKGIDYAKLRKLVKEWRSINHLYYGDYYPLTPHSTARNTWIGWQFDSPEKNEGMVQAFRRDECESDSTTLKLRGLDAKACYKVTNIDTEKSVSMSGQDLMQKGLTIKCQDKPGAIVIKYKKSAKK